jgi:hypothetical protein
MEFEGSLQQSKLPDTCPYPEPVPSSPCPKSHSLNFHPALHRLLVFHVPNLILYFCCTKVSVRSEAYSLTVLQHNSLLDGRVVSTSPKPLGGKPLFVGCPRQLLQNFRSYPPYWRPFLHPESKTHHAMDTWTHKLGSICNICKIFKWYGLTFFGP